MISNGTHKTETLGPSEVWLELMKLPRPHRRVPIPRAKPGTEEPVGYVEVWALTQEEQMAANAEADRFTKKLLQDPQRKDEANLGYDHTYTNEVAVQVLVRACRDVNDINRPAFPSADLLRKHFSSDEIGVLFAEFCTAKAEIGPIRAYMTAEESEALIMLLHEGGSAFPFDTLSWEQQRILVSSMASRLVNCWTAMSSAGLQLDVSTYALERLSSKKSAASHVADNSEDPSDGS